MFGLHPAEVQSPPTQGAWIEIAANLERFANMMSPPTQGAWIEIYRCRARLVVCLGRPLHRGRGLKYEFSVQYHFPHAPRRPLHRGRGLKCHFTGKPLPPICRPLHRGRGLKYAALSSCLLTVYRRPLHRGRGLK